MVSLEHTSAGAVIGLILAGGEGQRVGRQNKGLLSLQGKPLVQHVAERLKPQVNTLLISANQDIKSYQQFTPNVVTDDAQCQGKGPLAGILSTQSFYQKADLLQVVPCDTPFIPNDLVATLKHALLSEPHYDIAYAATATHDHPSIFLCKASINANLAEHLAQGKHSLKSWIFKHNAIRVLFADEQAFININYMETLQEYQGISC